MSDSNNNLTITSATSIFGGGDTPCSSINIGCNSSSVGGILVNITGLVSAAPIYPGGEQNFILENDQITSVTVTPMGASAIIDYAVIYRKTPS